MDDSEVSAELRVCWLVDAPFHEVEAFWEALETRSNTTRRSHSYIKRAFHPTYRRMKKAGWMNISSLEKGHNSLPRDARSILDRVRVHSISTNNPTNSGSRNASNLPSLLMVLNPYNYHIYIGRPDYPRVSSEAVPICVPYVVLKQSNLVFNRLTFDQDDFSRAHIASLTEQSLRYLNYRYQSPPNSNGDNLPDNIIPLDGAATASEHLDPGAECVICLETILPKEQTFVILHCLHPFHAECLGQWKLEKKFGATCPSCRGSIVTLYHHRKQ